MAVKIHPDCINDAFELYLKYNGERFDLIDEEMHHRGWTTFKAHSTLKNRGLGKNFREGWIERFGWKKSLEIKIATTGMAAATSAESLLFEVETLRKKIFMELQTKGVGSGQKDLIYQHDKYVARTTEILASLDKARDNYANFIFFLQHLLRAATRISPELAAAICDAEEPLLDWAEREFVNDPESSQRSAVSGANAEIRNLAKDLER